jgi:small multidrug resistance pump
MWWSWTLLFVAIGFEVCGTTCMKLSQGFARPLPSVLIFVCYGLCFVALTLAMKRIDLGVAYAIWCGLGIVLITAIDRFFFNGSLGAGRLIFIALVVAGVAGLQWTARDGSPPLPGE